MNLLVDLKYNKPISEGVTVDKKTGIPLQYNMKGYGRPVLERLRKKWKHKDKKKR